jgi:hypothetical protein
MVEGGQSRLIRRKQTVAELLLKIRKRQEALTEQLQVS